jgi:hypothetical protein
MCQFSRHFFVRQWLAARITYNMAERAKIASGILPLIVAECLFIHVAEQMVRRNANMGSIQVALHQTREILQGSLKHGCEYQT